MQSVAWKHGTITEMIDFRRTAQAENLKNQPHAETGRFTFRDAAPFRDHDKTALIPAP